MFCEIFLDFFLIKPPLLNTFLFQSPHISSSSSSSEGDEEEADGEVGGEPHGQQEELSSGKTNSPPPSYNLQQVLNTLNTLSLPKLVKNLVNETVANTQLLFLSVFLEFQRRSYNNHATACGLFFFGTKRKDILRLFRDHFNERSYLGCAFNQNFFRDRTKCVHSTDRWHQTLAQSHLFLFIDKFHFGLVVKNKKQGC